MQFRISLYRSCQSMINSDHDLLQGDPEKPEPINFIITPTKMKQNYSNFVHLNFCLCMVIPQSFSNLECFAQNLCSLLVPNDVFGVRDRLASVAQNLSITRTPSSLGISLIFAAIAALSSPIV